MAILSTVIFCMHVHGDVMPARRVGMTIQPRQDVPIRMLSEAVDITIDNNFAHVHCRFVLQNMGFSDTLEVGFPRTYSDLDLYNFAVNVYYYNTNNRIYPPVTDKKLNPISVDESGVEIPLWTTFPMPCYHEGEIIMVSINYSLDLLRKNKMVWSDLLFRYILKTGALWEGTIGDALITVRILNTKPEQISSISPEGYRRDNNVITWHLTDFEPDEDIEIEFIQDVVYDRTQEADRLLKNDPADAHGHYLMGTILYGQSSSGISCAEAVEHFEQAVASDPEHWDARFFLAMAYFKQPDKQLEQLETIIRNKPEYQCTDEVLERLPWIYPKTVSAREWLDMLKNNIK